MKFDQFKELVAQDYFRYTGKSVSLFLFIKKIFNPGFRYTFLMRSCRYFSIYNPIGATARILLRRYKFKYGYQIPYQTTIGGGLYISHFGGVVINSKVTIGRNCNLAHNVTIGQSNRGKTKGIPTIGDRVWVGTGSVVVGKISIGDNVLIAPNAYVNFDVPANSIVIGNPAKISSKENATEGYINRIS
jgi:serine O-acetyltransferase